MLSEFTKKYKEISFNLYANPMIKKPICAVLFFLMFAFLDCSKQFNFKKNSDLIIKELYYESWISGVKGGESGFNIHLTLEKKLEKNLEIQGIYFKQYYCELGNTKENQYLGHITTGSNREANSEVVPVVSDEVETTNLPFVLEGDDAVLVYVERKKIRYLKLLLIEREMKSLPM